MKIDMSGAAAVAATLQACSPRLGCRSASPATSCCTDNMPSGRAMKLGDVLTFRNGKTVEVLNTDAEGRLVLADGLCSPSSRSRDAIVDIATLTGACVVGRSASSRRRLHATTRPSARPVLDAPRQTDEPVWQLPLETELPQAARLQVADMKNVGGPYGGAITAALFLQEFVGEMPWAHLDIAGTMNSDADDGWLSKGATAFGTWSADRAGDELPPLTSARGVAGECSEARAVARLAAAHPLGVLDRVRGDTPRASSCRSTASASSPAAAIAAANSRPPARRPARAVRAVGRASTRRAACAGAPASAAGAGVATGGTRRRTASPPS